MGKSESKFKCKSKSKIKSNSNRSISQSKGKSKGKSKSESKSKSTSKSMSVRNPETIIRCTYGTYNILLWEQDIFPKKTFGENILSPGQGIFTKVGLPNLRFWIFTSLF